MAARTVRMWMGFTPRPDEEEKEDGLDPPIAALVLLVFGVLVLDLRRELLDIPLLDTLITVGKTAARILPVEIFLRHFRLFGGGLFGELSFGLFLRRGLRVPGGLGEVVLPLFVHRNLLFTLL